MKKLSFINGLFLVVVLIITACDDGELEDVIPQSFFKILLNPDDIYMYNSDEITIGVRLDPLLNDSIKVDVNVTYSTPTSGTISFIENEGWFYKPDVGFYGEDSFTYTVCREGKCTSAAITMHVEKIPDPNSCTFEINGESIETFVDQPVSIRIFDNDMVCPYMGSSIWAPEKGSFTNYSYSGNYKNTVYVYFPPKGYTGTDRFKYRLYTSTGYLETYCTITIKQQ